MGVSKTKEQARHQQLVAYVSRDLVDNALLQVCLPFVHPVENAHEFRSMSIRVRECAKDAIKGPHVCVSMANEVEDQMPGLVTPFERRSNQIAGPTNV